ncbi:MAG: cbb3-type cytochrome c oxidase subunit I [Candidatus Zixiibacteriota bacterium]
MQLRQSGKNLVNWLITANSQRVALLYLLTFGAFVLVGASAALVMQLELWGASSTLFSGQFFGHILTQHGVVMTFVVLIPLIPAVIGNFVLPSAVGARDMAMPRWNMVGWIVHLLGSTAVVVAVELGAYDTGWTMTIPSVATGTYQLLIAGLFFVAASTLIVNCVVARTILSRKHRTLPMSKLPILAWFFLVSSLVVLIVSPIRLFTLTMLSSQHFGLTPVFSLLEGDGIIQYQHLFWAYAGPATSATLLPALGITFEVLAARTGTVLFARRALIVAGIMLGQFSLIAWGRHLLVTTDSEPLALAGSLFSLLTVVPISLILLSWFIMLSRVRSWKSVPILITGLQTIFVVIGGFAGIMLAIPSTGLMLHDSYTTTGHLHLIALGLVFLSFLTGLFHWWPVIMQRTISPRAGRAVAICIVIGIMTTYFPMLVNGLGGLPKALSVYPAQFEMMHKVSTAGAVVLMTGLLGAIWLLARSTLGGVSRPHEVVPDAVGEFAYANVPTPRIQEEA